MNLKRMTFNDARDTWRGMTLRAWGMQLVIVFQMLVIGVLAYSLSQAERTIVFAPSLADEETFVTKSQASITYWENFSMMTSTLLGNLQPGNVDFVISRLRELVAPEAYRAVMDMATKEFDEIQKQSLSLHFEPMRIIYDQPLDTYFVHGRQHVILPSGRPRTQELTYEMRWRLENYRPRLIHVDTYPGEPRTTELLTRQAGGN